MNRTVMTEEMDRNLIYITEIAAVDLPVELRADMEDMYPMFSVRNSKGVQLALVGNRNLAYELARQNDLVPMVVQ